ncbi:replication initiation protein [Clostridium lacusfryxellense]|uniref:replication initiation protein n=1 Tax=Clostridium lacusfryxellense TaxID=205328 RepID=UPI001C0B9B43|nr:replication initiation protein [Clostridium lacusfryxellense]MBU3114543.1 replication initiation protein [Clostridium lacusfryxellense]
MDENYLVTKSNYFIMNSSYDLSLEEQKIILTIASMVQPTDEEFKPYNFKISEFMELVGVEDKSKYTEIPKITKELMKKVFEIQEGNTIIQTAWLSGVRYEKGSGMVTLKFNPDLKPYMIKLNTVFTQYKLTNILSMRSKYSIRMYEILKANQFKKQNNIEIDIYELRKLLKADNVYPLYNDFKRFVIQRTQKELKKLSDIHFDFEEIKTGRKVTSLKFYISANKTKNKALDEVCVTTEYKNTNKEEKCSTDLISVVKTIFKEDIDGLQAKSLLDTANGDINIIKEKYKYSETVPKIDNIVGWVINAIKKDYQPPKGKVKKDNFTNYEQRVYDFDDLEKKLLGWDKEERA